MRTLLIVGLTTLVSALVTTGTARAACNAVPAVTTIYRSTAGGVDRRLAGPGDEVTVVNGCPGDQAFDPVAANNEVSVRVGSSTPKTTTASKVGYCGTTPCKVVFTMPDTDPSSGPSYAGPATIVVTPKGQPTVTLAQIDVLREPVDPRFGCDQTAPDETFGSFTVLPRTNAVKDLENGGAALRMTTDGRGDILIPLAHVRPIGAPPGVTWAQVERGVGTFCSRQPVLDAFCYSIFGRRPVDEELAAANDVDLLQAFTPAGARIAPLFIRDRKGQLFGLADADASVLRIRNDGRFDFGYLRDNDTAPIVVRDSQKREVGECEIARLQGLRHTAALVATTSASGELWIRSTTDAGKKCQQNGTRAFPITTDLGGGRMEPVVDADAQDLALVDATTQQVRTFDASGGETTPKPSEVADPVGLAVNHFPIAVQTGRVFFRTPAANADVLDIRNKAFATIAGRAHMVEVSGTHAGVIDDSGQLLAYDAASATAPSVQLASGAKTVAIADALLGAVDGGGGLVVWPWPTTATAPGTAPPSSESADQLGASKGCWIDAPGVCTPRPRIIFRSPAAAQLLLASIDASGALTITTPACRDTATSPALPCTAVEFVAGDRLVAFRDAQSRMMYVGAFRDPGSTGGQDFVTRTTGTTALGPSSRWHDLGWRTPYLVTDEDVLFLTSVSGEERLAVYHYRSDTVRIVEPKEGSTTPLVADVLAGKLSVLGGGLALGDEDGDGILDAFDVCPHVADPRQVDVDHDGLGEASGSDLGCDPTLCTDLVPAPSLKVRPSLENPTAAADRALAYLEARLDTDRRCFAEHGGETADLDTVCLGSFVADAENPRLQGPMPQEVEAERALADALGATRAKGKASSFHVARQVIRAYGEAADAIARITASSRATEVSTLLERAQAMHACAASQIEHGFAPIGKCFGALRGGELPSPWATTSADCVTWRRTVLAETTLLGEVD